MGYDDLHLGLLIGILGQNPQNPMNRKEFPFKLTGPSAASIGKGSRPDGDSGFHDCSIQTSLLVSPFPSVSQSKVTAIDFGTVEKSKQLPPPTHPRAENDSFLT